MIKIKIQLRYGIVIIYLMVNTPDKPMDIISAVTLLHAEKQELYKNIA